MADNVAITLGVGTNIAADDISSVYYQRVKPTWGADGVATDTAVATPLPTMNTIESSQISNLGTIATPIFVGINTSAVGDSTLVAGVGGKKIRVLTYTIVCDSAVVVKFTSAAGGTALTGPMSFQANGGIHTAFSPVGHFETAAAAALVMNLTTAVGVRGHMVYCAVA